MRAFTQLWDELTAQRYGVQDRGTGGSATASRSTPSA
jgi:hypothetical protein